MRSKNKTGSRRSLLKAGLAAAVAASVAKASLLENFRNPFSSTTDVIVIGAGAAGLAAAVEAAGAGAEVLLLEKMPDIGGNTLISGGFYAAVDPVRQKRQGIVDSESLYYEQTFKFGGEVGDPKLVAHMVSNATETLAWLEFHGMKFHDEVFELYGAHWPRCHSPILPLGHGYIRTLSALAIEKKVRIETNTAVQKLLMDGECVCGVLAVKGGKKKEYFCRKAVIVASGSFVANPDLVAKYAPKLAGLTTNNSPGSTGEVMMAAHECGAALRDMQYIQCLPGCVPGKKFRVRFHNDVSHFILVDHEGRRFVREDGPRNDLRDAVLAQPGGYAFIIIDHKGFKQSGILVQKEAVKALEGGEAWKAGSIEELAAKIHVSPGNLRETIRDYNLGVSMGKDSFGKLIHSLTLPIEEAPLWAAYAGMTLHYSEGGLAINVDAQCLREDGSPIKGLFAAGAVTGGVHGNNRLGANGLTDALVFGRTAGKKAVLNG